VNPIQATLILTSCERHGLQRQGLLSLVVVCQASTIPELFFHFTGAHTGRFWDTASHRQLALGFFSTFKPFALGFFSTFKPYVHHLAHHVAFFYGNPGLLSISFFELDLAWSGPGRFSMQSTSINFARNFNDWFWYL
jgi:hypothetical protein